MCFSLKSFCGEKKETTKSSQKYNPTNDVLHHIEDAHEWHFWGKGEKSVSKNHTPNITWEVGLWL